MTCQRYIKFVASTCNIEKKEGDNCKEQSIANTHSRRCVRRSDIGLPSIAAYLLSLSRTYTLSNRDYTFRYFRRMTTTAAVPSLSLTDSASNEVIRALHVLHAPTASAEERRDAQQVSVEMCIERGRPIARYECVPLCIYIYIYISALTD